MHVDGLDMIIFPEIFVV